MAYNGWTNKETWLVNLWLGDMFQCDIEDGLEITPGFIESIVKDMLNDMPETWGLFSDLLNCALGEINYHEIASHYEIEKSLCDKESE